MEKYFTTEQVAKILQVHRFTILRFIKKGKLKGIKLGRMYRIKESDVQEFLEERMTKTDARDKILKTYIQSKTLSTLADHLPLSTPFTVGIDPSNICNFACSFCPTGHPDLLKKVGRPLGKMDFGLFKQIIDGMKGFPDKVKRLYLYHEGEPLLNPHIADMLAYTRRADVTELVQMTTNGALLKPKMADALLDADFDLIRISVEHVDDDGYHHLTGRHISYEQIRRNVEYLFNERDRRGSRLRIHPKIMDTNLTPEQKEKFVRDFQPIGDLLNIQKLGKMPASEGIDFTLGTNPEFSSSGAPFKSDRIVCPHPFYVMVVKWSGEVVTCSEEWRWENIVGDAKHQTLPEIWNSEPLQQFRLTHLRGDRDSISHCRNCPSVGAFPAENDIDDVREPLLEFYSRPLAGDGNESFSQGIVGSQGHTETPQVTAPGERLMPSMPRVKLSPSAFLPPKGTQE